MNVVVAGAGYVGPTISVTLAYVGHCAACVDADKGRIELLHSGRVPISEAGLAAVSTWLEPGRVSPPATGRPARTRTM